MSRSFERFTDSFLAQASSAISSDSDSNGAYIDYDASKNGNIDGCDRGVVEIDVTAPQSGDATCVIFATPLQFDGSGYASKIRLGSVKLGSSAAKYSVKVDIPSEKGRIVLHADGNGFRASARLRGVYVSTT